MDGIKGTIDPPPNFRVSASPSPVLFSTLRVKSSNSLILNIMVNLVKSLSVLAAALTTVSSTTVQKRDSSAFLNTLPTLVSAVSAFDGVGPPSITGNSVTTVNVSIK
jgi:hypothetical protein